MAASLKPLGFRLCTVGRIALAVVYVLLLSTLVALPQLTSSPPPVPEYKMKAVFLYNFAKFVEWPDQHLLHGEIVIGIMDPSVFGDALSLIEGRRAKNRKVVIKTCNSIKDAEVCNILFLNTNNAYQMDSILAALRDKPVLTVGEAAGFSKRKKGHINFKINGKNLRFTINLKASRKAGLKISSQLLEVAEKVYQ